MKNPFLSCAISLIALSGYCQTGNPAPYCASVFDNNYNMVQSVSVGGTNFNVGPVGAYSAQNSYTFFNNATFPSLPIGGATTVAINFYGVMDIEPRYFGVWIDFNNNQTFDAAEMVMNNANSIAASLPVMGATGLTASLAISVPSTAVAGTTRMRIVRAQTPTGSPYALYSPTVQVLACNPLAPNNAYGCTYDFQVTLLSGSLPVSNFSFTPAQVCSGKQVIVSDLSTNAPSTWTWTAAGASPSVASVQNPTLVFNSPGVFTIGLVSSNSTGSSVPATKTINVLAAPQMTVTPALVSICAKRSTSLVVTGAATYSWSTGATSSTLAISPSVTTVYSVTGTSSTGCSASMSRTVSVSACVGIEENILQQSSTLVISPNPARTSVEIRSVQGNAGTVLIYNAVGALMMYQTTEGTLSINLENLPNGIYYVSFVSIDGERSTTKLIHH